MARTDRLHALIGILRDGRLHRAQDLARRLGVSLRTVYRDMETLQASGVAVEGERGLGYQVTAQAALPPLNLTLAEMEALQLGLEIVGQVADAELQAAARSLSAKIDAAEPGGTLPAAAMAPMARGFRHMPLLRAAIGARQKLRLAWEGEAGPVTGRIVRPLRLDYWGRVWSLTAWCESRGGFRVLPVDRLERVEVLPELFVDEPGKRLEDMLDRGAGARAAPLP